MTAELDNLQKALTALFMPHIERLMRGCVAEEVLRVRAEHDPYQGRICWKESEAARVCGISRRMLSYLRRRGIIPYTTWTDGGDYYYLVEHLEAVREYLRARQQQASMRKGVRRASP